VSYHYHHHHHHHHHPHHHHRQAKTGVVTGGDFSNRTAKQGGCKPYSLVYHHHH
jgi:hypothetical protein